MGRGVGEARGEDGGAVGGLSCMKGELFPYQRDPFYLCLPEDIFHALESWNNGGAELEPSPSLFIIHRLEAGVNYPRHRAVWDR